MRQYTPTPTLAWLIVLREPISRAIPHNTNSTAILATPLRLDSGGTTVAEDGKLDFMYVRLKVYPLFAYDTSA